MPKRETLNKPEDKFDNKVEKDTQTKEIKKKTEKKELNIIED